MHTQSVELINKTIDDALTDEVFAAVQLNGWTLQELRARLRTTMITSVEKILKAEDGPIYDPEFGDDRVCGCGHPYYRHFDTYEDMLGIGCKYCDCGIFQVEG